MNNGNLKINFNGKNQYIEMSCHEFLDCLSYYISQNKIKTKIFEQLIETKKEFLSQETEKINEFSSGTLYYPLSRSDSTRYLFFRTESNSGILNK